jgi:hypothetical protein
MHKLSTVAIIAVLFTLATGAFGQPLTIRAGTMLDGKGGMERNALIAIEGIENRQNQHGHERARRL